MTDIRVNRLRELLKSIFPNYIKIAVLSSSQQFHSLFILTRHHHEELHKLMRTH